MKKFTTDSNNSTADTAADIDIDTGVEEEAFGPEKMRFVGFSTTSSLVEIHPATWERLYQAFPEWVEDEGMIIIPV